MIQGSCLGGAVTFRIRRDDVRLYRCHCTLCQQVTSTSGNAATMLACAEFEWLSGEGNVTSWRKPSGFRSDFCRTWGSPVPNPIGGQHVWVPAGALDRQHELSLVAHQNTESIPSWARMNYRW